MRNSESVSTITMLFPRTRAPQPAADVVASRPPRLAHIPEENSWASSAVDNLRSERAMRRS